MSRSSSLCGSRNAMLHCSSVSGGGMPAPAPGSRPPLQARGRAPLSVCCRFCSRCGCCCCVLASTREMRALMTPSYRSSRSRGSSAPPGNAVRESPPVVGRVIGDHPVGLCRSTGRRWTPAARYLVVWQACTWGILWAGSGCGLGGAPPQETRSMPSHLCLSGRPGNQDRGPCAGVYSRIHAP